ncbi:hypothetical protein PVAP13_2KG212591 [Panicum virgatum]|uniref:Uncharacterized protein n=1 Tax=Panicum virgatum TaxID=38727 RepID=A0A8T0WA13_PANVG|nr:hypothetical protein PVAP13_2KG212591 [Panicum virgatum]
MPASPMFLLGLLRLQDRTRTEAAAISLTAGVHVGNSSKCPWRHGRYCDIIMEASAGSKDSAVSSTFFHPGWQFKPEISCWLAIWDSKI